MKRIAWLVAMLALLTGACSPQNAATPTATDAPAATPPPIPTGDTGPVAPTPSQEDLINRALSVQPDDWSRGPENAIITIIEWGDFQ